MRSFLAVLCGRILQLLTAFLTLRIMTTRLGAEGLGRYTIIFSVTTLFALLFISPVGMYINRHLHRWIDEGCLWPNFRWALIYNIGVAAIAAVCIPTFMWLAKPDWSVETTTLTALVVGSILINTANQTLIPAFNLLEHRFTWVVLSTLSLWFSLGFAVLFTLDTQSAARWISGQLLGLLAGTLMALWPFIRLAQKNRNGSKNAPSSDRLSEVATFALPLALTVGLNWAQFQSYRLYLGPLTSLEFLGLFAAAYTLASGLMSAFENLMHQFFYPRLYQESNRSEFKNQAWANYASVSIPLTLWAGILVATTSRSLIKIMLAPEFHKVTFLVLISVGVETCRVIGNVYAMAGHISLRTKIMIKPQAIGAILVLVGLSTLLRLTDASSALAGSLLAASVGYLVASHVQVKRALGIKLEPQHFAPLALTLPPSAVAYFVMPRLPDRPIFHLGFVILFGISMLPAAWFIAGHTILDRSPSSAEGTAA